jgi:glycosyltransferase involved in cell wall biosynthesis
MSASVTKREEEVGSNPEPTRREEVEAPRSSRPLRVLHVCSVETSNYYLNNLRDFTDPDLVQFSFVTFAPRGGFVTELERRGARAYALAALNRWQYPQAIRRLWKIIQQEDVDIVHTHLFGPTVIGLVLSQLSGKRVMLTRHHSDAIHRIPSAVKRKFYQELENYINRSSDHIIAPSQMVRDILVKREGVPAAKVSLIPYGQTSERFDAITTDEIARVRAELQMEDNLALVCTARLYETKGHVYLFEALAPLVRSGLKTTLYLVGTGEYRPQLEKLSQAVGLQEQVRFLGWRDDALSIIAAADIVVHPSCEDALSSAVIEALMLERPIIATDISGVRDTLDDGQFGTIVPAADAHALRVALENMIANLDSARERARLGRQHITTYMDAGRVAHATTEVYQKVCGFRRLGVLNRK